MDKTLSQVGSQTYRDEDYGNSGLGTETSKKEFNKRGEYI